MRAVPVGQALVVIALAAAVTTSPGRAQAPEPGDISGHVRLTARIRGTPLPSNVYQPRSVGRHDALQVPEIRNVVVYLRGVAPRDPLPALRHQIQQRHEAFLPRVLPITRGSTVEFPNGDPYFHNVFSLSSASAFDLGRYPQGQARSRQFTRPGLVKVYCHIHSQMTASILVLDHPYFAVPDADGRFTLAGVPPGRHTIVGWHERVGERATTIDVAAGQRATIELALPLEDAK
jgi:plastocyanin